MVELCDGSYKAQIYPAVEKGVSFCFKYVLLVVAGELGKLEMLHEGILHKCIQQLLEKKKNTPLRDMAEDLECLCQIIRTVGPRLDSRKARVSVK